jgi:predicted NAD-dependent protein-ADP-ribosyltransferase YbiA (DUF1768 family)
MELEKTKKRGKNDKTSKGIRRNKTTKICESNKIEYLTPNKNFFKMTTEREYIKNEKFIQFHSNAKDNYNLLSNFAEIKEGITIDGITYPSSEHAYQSQKYIDKIRFSVDGDLGNIKGFSLVFDDFENKKKFWMKKNNIGIIAKMSTNKNLEKKLGLIRDEKFIPNDDIWYIILSEKFKIEPFRQILLNTGDIYLLEFSRSAKKLYEQKIINFWGGMIDDGVLYGNNKMGKLLMNIRLLI